MIMKHSGDHRIQIASLVKNPMAVANSYGSEFGDDHWISMFSMDTTLLFSLCFNLFSFASEYHLCASIREFWYYIIVFTADVMSIDPFTTASI